MTKRFYSTLFVLFLFFSFLPNNLSAQFCCCPVCPECIADAGGCGFTCAILSSCNDASFAESSSDPACLGTACNALPVRLVFFKTRNTSTGVSLSWKTESEEENEGYEIERMSGTTMEWELIEFVRGQGTTAEAHEYFFEDKSAPPGNNYYRLKQIDFDGAIAISDVKAAKVNSTDNYDLFPTLAKDFIFISSNEKKLVANKVEIFNTMGQKLLEGSFDYYTGGNIDISALPNGNYVVFVSNENGHAQSLRFIKSK